VLAACKVAQAIQDWEKEYQRKNPHKFMLPTVQIGAIDGGNAFKPGTRPTTDIFVIVKMLPGAVPLAIKRDIEQVVERVTKARERYSRHSRRSLPDHARLRNFEERTCG
jgi:hypothetical protein